MLPGLLASTSFPNTASAAPRRRGQADRQRTVSDPATYENPQQYAKGVPYVFVNGTVVIDIKASMPTAIAGLWGNSDMPIEVRSTAARADGTRVLDVAMCIDETGSMQFLLDSVKANAMGFFPALNAEFVARSIQPFDSVRIRPIFFRDYGGNGAGGHYDVATGGQVDKFPFWLGSKTSRGCPQLWRRRLHARGTWIF